jgi:hypothetical protein
MRQFVDGVTVLGPRSGPAAFRRSEGDEFARQTDKAAAHRPRAKPFALALHCAQTGRSEMCPNPARADRGPNEKFSFTLRDSSAQ